MTTFESYLYLISQQESEYLDFKREHVENNANLVHDILCLSNSRTDKDRFLIIGIDSENENAPNDIVLDKNRKTQAQLIDTLRNANFSHLPDIRILSGKLSSGETVDIIKIANKPLKPYFLLKDYRVGQTTVRAGVIYGRDLDANTPLDKSSSMSDIEWMFRQRFGIDQSPLQRAKINLLDTTSWCRDYDEGLMFFYHQLFPEIIIQEVKFEEGDSREKFDEAWVRIFPDRKAFRSEFYLKYHSTKLASLFVIWCDGARWIQVQPMIFFVNSEMSNTLSYYMVEDSLECLVQEMINSVCPQHSRHYIDNVINTFTSESDAKKTLMKDWQEGVKDFTFFHYDQDKNLDYLINSNGKRLLYNLSAH